MVAVPAELTGAGLSGALMGALTGAERDRGMQVQGAKRLPPQLARQTKHHMLIPADQLLRRSATPALEPLNHLLH